MVKGFFRYPNITHLTASHKCRVMGVGVSTVWRHPAGPEREGGLGPGLHGTRHCGLDPGRRHREEPPGLGRQLCEQVEMGAQCSPGGCPGQPCSASLAGLPLTTVMFLPGSGGQFRCQRPGP